MISVFKQIVTIKYYHDCFIANLPRGETGVSLLKQNIMTAVC